MIVLAVSVTLFLVAYRFRRPLTLLFCDESLELRNPEAHLNNMRGFNLYLEENSHVPNSKHYRLMLFNEIVADYCENRSKHK
jgi:hypothetical protein